jgi:hypothetical protein
MAHSFAVFIHKYDQNQLVRPSGTHYLRSKGCEGKQTTLTANLNPVPLG